MSGGDHCLSVNGGIKKSIIIMGRNKLALIQECVIERQN